MPEPLAAPPVAAPPYLLTTLGEVALLSADRREGPPVLGPGKPLALLIYLALSPGRSANREHLADLLWSDLEPERARHALRQTLYFLRQQLGDAYLLSRGGDIHLSGSLETDRDAFLHAVDSNELELAAELYRGPFLPGFASPGGIEFEQWADLERTRLRSTFMRAGEALARRFLASSAIRPAQRVARRVRDEDPLDEGGWRLLIEALLAGQDVLAANIEADGLTSLIKTEGREPEPATRAMLRLVRQRPAADDPSPAPGAGRGLLAELVGREREFAAIIDAWERARRGRARHLHLVAPAGLGKTRLVNDVHARLRAGGGMVVHLRANPGDRRIAYALAGELARALGTKPGAAAVSPAAAGALLALHPELSSHFSAPLDQASGEEALRRRTMALVETIGVVADETPLALLIDDVHWADPSSQQLLLGMLERIEGKVLVVTTARPSRDGTVEVALTERLGLEPLNAAQVGALLASLGGLPRSEWAAALPAAIHETSGGSPLLVLETLQLALDRGSLALGPGGWSCPDPVFLITQLRAGGALRHRIAQLDPGDRRLLLLLATAGSRLTLPQIAAALGRTPEGAEAELLGLERRGFIARSTGGEWEVMHDQIAEIAVESAAPDALREIHAALGKVIMAQSEQSPELMPRAAHHLVAGGCDGELSVLFGRWLRFASRRGDHRRPALLAHELTGDDAPPELVHWLVARQPLWRRFFHSPARRAGLAVAGIAALAAVGVATFRQPTPPPAPATLLALWAGPGDTGMVTAVPITRDMLDATDPLPLRPTPIAWRLLQWSRVLGNPQPRPGAPGWIFGRSTQDAGVIDLFLRDGNGRERRLTENQHDDSDPAWSPDGRSAVFVTTRWADATGQQADLAVIDPASGRVRRLTSEPAQSGTPVWSPDGSRIGFTRRQAGQESTQLCWVTVDGGSHSCTVPSGYDVIRLLAWTDPHQLLVLADSADRQVILRIGVDDGAIRMVDAGPVNQASASPDGRWIAAFGQRSDERRSVWRIYPTEDPSRTRRLRFRDGRNGTVFWTSSAAANPYLARLSIVRPRGPLALTAPYQLTAIGADTAGNPLTVPDATLRWRSRDTTVVLVDSISGLVQPRRVGRATVIATAGGWREDSAIVTVEQPTAHQVLSERWSTRLESNWVPFGDPLPRLAAGPDSAPAFWNAGDGTFTSGVYSRQSYDGSNGIGLEATLSTPITQSRWQLVRLSLNAGLDSTALAGWDRRSGMIPSSPYDSQNACRLEYPGGLGRAATSRFQVSAGGSSTRIAAEPAIGSGQWYRVILQLFPDGSCALAINGRAVWHSSAPVPLDRPFRVVLHGSSVDTRVLVGPVTVWTGVREGIDWR